MAEINKSEAKTDFLAVAEEKRASLLALAEQIKKRIREQETVIQTSDLSLQVTGMMTTGNTDEFRHLKQQLNMALTRYEQERQALIDVEKNLSAIVKEENFVSQPTEQIQLLQTKCDEIAAELKNLKAAQEKHYQNLLEKEASIEDLKHKKDEDIKTKKQQADETRKSNLNILQQKKNQLEQERATIQQQCVELAQKQALVEKQKIELQEKIAQAAQAKIPLGPAFDDKEQLLTTQESLQSNLKHIQEKQQHFREEETAQINEFQAEKKSLQEEFVNEQTQLLEKQNAIRQRLLDLSKTESERETLFKQEALLRHANYEDASKNVTEQLAFLKQQFEQSENERLARLMAGEDEAEIEAERLAQQQQLTDFAANELNRLGEQTKEEDLLVQRSLEEQTTIQEKHKQLHEELADVEKALQELPERKDLRMVELTEIENSFKAMQKHHLDTLSKESEQIQEHLKEVEKQIAELAQAEQAGLNQKNEIAADKKQLSDRVNELAALQEEMHKHTQAIEELNQKITDCILQVNTLDKNFVEKNEQDGENIFDAELLNLRQEVKETRQLYTEAEMAVAEKENLLHELESSIDKLKTTDHDKINNNDLDLQAMEEKRRLSENALHMEKEQIDRINQQLADFARQKYEAKRQHLQDLQYSMANKRTAKKNVKKEKVAFKEIEAQIADLDVEIDREKKKRQAEALPETKLPETLEILPEQEDMDTIALSEKRKPFGVPTTEPPKKVVLPIEEELPQQRVLTEEDIAQKRIAVEEAISTRKMEQRKNMSKAAIKKAEEDERKFQEILSKVAAKKQTETLQGVENDREEKKIYQEFIEAVARRKGSKAASEIQAALSQAGSMPVTEETQRDEGLSEDKEKNTLLKMINDTQGTVADVNSDIARYKALMQELREKKLKAQESGTENNVEKAMPHVQEEPEKEELPDLTVNIPQTEKPVSTTFTLLGEPVQEAKAEKSISPQVEEKISSSVPSEKPVPPVQTNVSSEGEEKIQSSLSQKKTMSHTETIEPPKDEMNLQSTISVDKQTKPENQFLLSDQPVQQQPVSPEKKSKRNHHLITPKAPASVTLQAGEKTNPTLNVTSQPPENMNPIKKKAERTMPIAPEEILSKGKDIVQKAREELQAKMEAFYATRPAKSGSGGAMGLSKIQPKPEDMEFIADSKRAILHEQSPWAALLLYTIAFFLAIAIIWAKFAILDEVTSGQGRVIPSSQVQLIQNLEGGILSEIYVKEGDRVKKDQILLRIDDKRFYSGYQEGRKKYLALLAAISRLNAEVKGDKVITYPAIVQKEAPELIAGENSLFIQQTQEIDAKIKTLQQSYDLAKEELAITKPLVNQGLMSQLELLRLEREINEIQGNINKEKDTFHSKAQQDLTDKQGDMTALGEALTAAHDRLMRTVVRSPVDGIVNKVNISTIGGVIQPGMNIMEIVPTEDNLLIEAKIKPKDIAFIHPDQPALVKISAYDYSIYGGLDGKVEHISADTIQENDTDNTGTASNAGKGESYYKILVRTQKNYLGTADKKLYIIPGMTVTVDIKTGKKSVLDYLLKPFLKARENALRER